MNNDLISRKALKEEINKRLIYGENGNDNSNDVQFTYAKVRKLIDNAPTVTPPLPTEVKKALEVLKVMKQGKWIPVSEKLPPNYILCLFCTTDGDIFYGYRNSENNWCEKGHTENISDIIAWQELPEPYKGGDAE